MTTVQFLLLAFGTLAFLAIGSFTCVIIDRLPVELDEPNEFGELYDTRPWREVLGGSSRCSSCGHEIKPYDNIPVLSWLLLRGKCRQCDAVIPAFHPLVELAVPILFLLAIWAIGTNWRILPLLWLIPIGVAVVVIDQTTLIVPTRLIWPGLFGSAILAALAVLFDGNWLWLRSAVVGILVFAGPLFVIWFIHPRGMGFGDVRLATLLGFSVGFYAGADWVGAALLAVMALALSAVVGLVIGVVALGARGRQAKVPFGPAMVVASLLACALAQPILSALDAFVL